MNYGILLCYYECKNLLDTLICAKAFPLLLLPYSIVEDIGYNVDILLSLIALGECPSCIIVG